MLKNVEGVDRTRSQGEDFRGVVGKREIFPGCVEKYCGFFVFL